MFPFDKLKYIQIEITNNCQAGCPMCPRWENPNKLMICATSCDNVQIDEYSDKVLNV